MSLRSERDELARELDVRRIATFGPEDDDAVALFDRADRALAGGGGGRAVLAARGGDVVGVSAELHRRDAVEALAVALLERDRYTGDIGKVGIPDAILNKPGPLTPEERAVMAEHPVIGSASCAASAASPRSRRSPATSMSPGTGRGTPRSSPRRERMSHADAFADLTRCAGKQFEAQVTAALVADFHHERTGRLREAS